MQPVCIPGGYPQSQKVYECNERDCSVGRDAPVILASPMNGRPCRCG